MKNIVLLFLYMLSIKAGFSQTTYSFIGNGKWSVPTNWSNNIIPPSTLSSGSTINISPIIGDSCILDVEQHISAGANLIIATGVTFIDYGNLVITGLIIPSVTICNQEWMLKNLDVVTYRNGDTIPNITDPTAWASLTTGAWCWYNNDSVSYASTYGRLYNWYAVNDSRGLAPIGWHIPTDAEWSTLSNCLGGDEIAGGALKDTGVIHWSSPNIDATNSSGFTGLPGGYRRSSGVFQSINSDGNWWSSTPIIPTVTTLAYFRFLYNGWVYFRPGTIPTTSGFSVRCLKD